VYICAHVHLPVAKSIPILPTPPEAALPVKVFPAICKQQSFMFCHHQLQGSRVDPCVMPSIADRWKVASLTLGACVECFLREKEILQGKTLYLKSIVPARLCREFGTNPVGGDFGGGGGRECTQSSRAQ